MGDNIEKYIQQNRDSFDDKTPRMDVWSNIEKELDQKKTKTKKIGWYRYAAIAASVLILLSIGTIFGTYISSPQNSTASSLSEISPEMADIELFYKKELDKKISKLTSFENYDTSVNDDLDQLEEVMKDLQKEMRKNPDADAEIIINAMIKNYQTRIEILERVITRFSQNPSNKKKKDEHTIDI